MPGFSFSMLRLSCFNHLLEVFLRMKHHGAFLVVACQPLEYCTVRKGPINFAEERWTRGRSHRETMHRGIEPLGSRVTALATTQHLALTPRENNIVPSETPRHLESMILRLRVRSLQTHRAVWFHRFAVTNKRDTIGPHRTPLPPS